MKNMRKTTHLIACLSIFATANGVAGDASKVQRQTNYASCELKKPPVGSSVVGAHGLRLLTFPRKISRKYTGCQKTWFDDGDLFLSLAYRDGRLREAIFLEPEKEKITCTYYRGIVTSGPAEICERIARDNTFFIR